MKLWSHMTKKEKLFQQILMKRKQPVKRKTYILLAFLSIIIALLIAVSIYCYLIKYLTRQKYLLPFQVKINKLKKLCINNLN